MLSHAFNASTSPDPVARSLPATALWWVAVLPLNMSLAVLHRIFLICCGESVGSFCSSSAITPAIWGAAADVIPSVISQLGPAGSESGEEGRAIFEDNPHKSGTARFAKTRL